LPRGKAFKDYPVRLQEKNVDRKELDATKKGPKKFSEGAV
jgi:hypothetical protein